MAINTQQNNPAIQGSYNPMAVPLSSGASSAVSNTSQQPINGAALGQSSPAVPQPVQNNTASNSLATTVGTFTQGAASNQIQQEQMQQQAPAAAPQNSRQGILDKISSLLGVQATQGDVSADIYDQEGVFEKKQLVTRLEGEAMAKERAYTKQAEKIRQNAEGKFGGAVQQDLVNLDRQKNSELADIAIQSKVAMGAYADANQIAEAKVKMQFEPLENQIKSLQNLYQLYGDDLTASEKMQAEAKIQEKRDAVNFAQQRSLLYMKAGIDAAERSQNLVNQGSLNPKVLSTNQYKSIEAYAPAVTAITAYEDAIKKWGSGEKWNATGAGEIKSAYGDAIAAWKTLAALGALSGADFGLAENVIPEPRILARDKKVLTQLSGALDRGSNQINFLANSLKMAYPDSVSGIDQTIGQIGGKQLPEEDISEIESLTGGSSKSFNAASYY